MSLILPGIIAILLYIIATVMQLRTVISNSDHEHWPKLLGGIAVLLHAWTALADLLDGTGIDLGVFPMLSLDRKSTRLNSSHSQQSRMPSSA